MFLTKRFYIAGLVIIVLLISGYMIPPLFIAGQIAIALLTLISATDGALLWRRKKAAGAERYCAPRFSNGDITMMYALLSKATILSTLKWILLTKYPSYFSAGIFFSEST